MSSGRRRFSIPSRMSVPRTHLQRRLLLAGSVAFLFVFASGIQAQEAVRSTSTSSLNYQTSPENSMEAPPFNPTPEPNLHSALVPENQVSSEPRRFQYEFKVTARGVYDDNINISQTNRVSDYYFTIEPVLTLGLGDIVGHEGNYIRLDYAPSLFLFLDHSEDDAVQQLIHLEGQHQFGRLTLKLGEDVAILDGTDLGNLSNASSPGSQVNLDVSGRTRFQIYTTRIGASYDLSGKTFLSSEIDSLVTQYDSASLFSSEMFSGNLFLNYRYSDKLTFGIGGTGGYDLADNPNPSQTFEQANANISYQASEKISLNASGGVEFRQFENNSRGGYIAPVFELGASYQPFDGTTITLSGNRRTYNSGVLAGQDFAGTTITAGLRQRLLQRFYFGIAGGYENSDYFSTVSGLTANRRDNYYFAEPSLDFSITRFWMLGAYYLHRQNDSSLQSFTFDDNQVGARTTLKF
jgi:hypothetical protein